MGETKKLGILVGIIVLLMITIGIISIVSNLQVKQLLKEIDVAMQSEEVQVFYLAQPTCHYCNLLKPVTDTLKEEYNLTYFEINTEKYNKSQLKKILKKLDVDISTFGTPHLVFTRNGEIIGQKSGYADENVIFEIFQTYGVIPQEATLAFQYLDYETFQSKWNGEKTIIMIGQAGEESVKARNHLKSLMTNHQLSISYMDIAETENTNSYTEFLETIHHSDSVTYPILMIVENGSILAETNATTEEAYLEFLKTNGYIA